MFRYFPWVKTSSLSTNTYCTCTPDLVLSTFWSTRDFLAPLWGECQALLRAHHPLLSRVPGLIHTPSTYYTRANSQKALVRMLKTEPGVYLLLRRATVSRLPQAGCQGRGVLLCLGRGGSLISCDPSQASLPQLHRFIMTWTPPGSLQTTLASSKYHICHLRLMVDYGCECEMESKRGWRGREEGVLPNWLQLHTQWLD